MRHGWHWTIRSLIRAGSAWRVAAFVGLCMTGGPVLALPTRPTRGFVNRVYIDTKQHPHRYVLFVPTAADAGEPWPVILFLHGIGEAGTDGVRQTKVGLGPVVRKAPGSFPFLIVFPQAQRGFWSAESPDSQTALAILADVEAHYPVDRRRIYLTGISLGGHGVWCLAEKDPKRWAALVPICGWSDPSQAARIKDIPCWCFHGAQDHTVPVMASRQMVEALRAAGGTPRYTEYPHEGHGCWNQAYRTPGLFTWLLAQHLK